MSPVRRLDESAFPAFVAALWEHQGWTTKLRDVEGETYVAAVQEGQASERGLIWAKSGSTGARVAGNAVVEFATFCRDNGIDDAAIITLGSFTEDGEKAAEKFGIDLLDGDELAAVVERHGLEDLVEEHTPAEDGSTADGPLASISESLGGLKNGLPDSSALSSVSEGVAGIRRGLGERKLDVPPKVALAVVVLAAVLVAGVVVGPSLGSLGAPESLGSLNPLGGDGDAVAAQPVEVSAPPVQPSGAATTLYVEWNATTRSTIDANASDDLVHVAPNGTRFVIVQLSVINTGEQAIDLRPAMFTLSINATTYDYQPLSGVAGFEETSLEAGGSYEGWTVFVVPENASEGSLGISQSAIRGTVAVQFAANPGLAVNATA